MAVTGHREEATFGRNAIISGNRENSGLGIFGGIYAAKNGEAIFNAEEIIGVYHEIMPSSSFINISSNSMSDFVFTDT